MLLRITTLLLAATLPLAAYAAPAPVEADPAPAVGEDVESIVVTGQRRETMRQLMLGFIVEIGDPAVRSRGYARWWDRLCVGIYNLPERAVAQYIADKISLIAQESGLRTGSPGCEPNLQIIFSPDARALAGSMVEDSPGMFRPFGGAGGTTQGFAALAQFKTSEAPVRWWQITMPVDETGTPAIALPGLGAPSMRGVASRITTTVSDAIWGNLIIVDAGKVSNVTWSQLADYLAMVALAQVDPDGLPTGYDSILNLFSTEAPSLGMTDMDRTYLRALYKMDMQILPYAQRGVLSNRMLLELDNTENAP